MVLTIDEVYQDYPEIPYISETRPLKQWLQNLELGVEKKVPLRNMQRTDEGLLAGHIILLWRISLGTFTNESVFPKYFEYDYGIDAPNELTQLIQEGYVIEESPLNSLDHVSAALLKGILTKQGQKGLSGLKKAELSDRILANFNDASLNEYFQVRGFALTPKGEAALANNQEVLEHHPMKKMYK